MIEERFYCECPRCSVHNKKTQDLAYNLKALRNSEFVFSEKFTPVMFFEVLKSVVAELNSEYRGREIKVEMMRFIDTISYTFKDDPNSDACLGSLRLTPIKTMFDSVKNLDIYKPNYDRNSINNHQCHRSWRYLVLSRQSFNIQNDNRGLQGIVGYCKQNENNNRSL